MNAIILDIALNSVIPIGGYIVYNHGTHSSLNFVVYLSRILQCLSSISLVIVDLIDRLE